MAAAQHLINNPMMSAAAVQYGSEFAQQGQAYVNQGVNRLLAITNLKTYFAVDTSYVLKKLSLLLFPYTHRNWMVGYGGSGRTSPTEDINAPDLYIPVMGFVTFVLLNGVVLGTQSRFTPEALGVAASSLLAWLAAEVLLLWLCLYLLAVTSQLRWLDIISFCGYKYVSMIVSVGLSLVGGSMVYYCALGYTALAITYFMIQSLRLTIQPHVVEGASKLRNYFLLVMALLQPVMMLWLTRSLVTFLPPTPSSLI
jgi:hypothetical protein